MARKSSKSEVEIGRFSIKLIDESLVSADLVLSDNHLHLRNMTKAKNVIPQLVIDKVDQEQLTLHKRYILLKFRYNTEAFNTFSKLSKSIQMYCKLVGTRLYEPPKVYYHKVI